MKALTWPTETTRALSKGPHPACGQASGPDAASSYRQVTEKSLGRLDTSTGCLTCQLPGPRAPRHTPHAPLHGDTEVQKGEAPGWGLRAARCCAGRGAEYSQQTPGTPFSHNQQWESSPTITYAGKAGPGGDTQNAGLRPGKGRNEWLSSAGAGMWGRCQAPNLESGLRIQIQPSQDDLILEGKQVAKCTRAELHCGHVQTAHLAPAADRHTCQHGPGLSPLPPPLSHPTALALHKQLMDQGPSPIYFGKVNKSEAD